MADQHQQPTPNSSANDNDLGVVLGTPSPDVETLENKNVDTAVRGSDGKEVNVHAANEASLGTGTIVTDKKKSSDSVLDVIQDAAGEWGGDRARAVKQKLNTFKKPEAPKVTPGTERKEVLQKSVHNAREVTQDDHRVVIERIKTLQQDAERVTGKPFVIKDKDPNAKGSWTHVTGSDAVESESASTQDSYVRREQITNSGTDAGAVAPHVEGHVEKELSDYTKNPTTADPVTRGDMTTKGVSQSIAPDTDVRTTVPQQEAPTTETQTAAIAPEQNIAHEVEKQVQPQPEKVSPAVEPPPVPTPPPAPVAAQPPVQSRFRIFRIVGVALFVLILAGSAIGGGVYLYLSAPTDTEPIVVSQFLGTSNIVSLTLPTDRTALLAALTDTTAHENATVEIQLVQETAGGKRPATSVEFFAVLQSNAPDALVRSIDPQMTIGVSQQQPFMVFAVDSFDIAFAGTLAWEATMSADLAPFFGTQATGTFVDETIGLYHTRVLYNADGTERIRYSFVTNNILIITTNTETLNTLLERI